jgi:hypothetical protein
MILKQLSEGTMNANYGIFKKLLTLDELFELYRQIGESILTCIDIENINKNREAKNNSIQLLIGTLLIAFDLDSKRFYKKLIIQNKASFITELFKMLFDNYPDAFSFINKAEIRYDEALAKYYTKRNFIGLDLSGLLMLLNGMEFVQFKDNNIYFIDTILKRRVDKVNCNQRKTSLLELKEQLAIQEQLGNEAEVVAFEFEKKNLLLKNILKIPERVSIFDVTVGYDIASYMTIDSEVPDKFIEVKSCADESMRFYISRNELETAKRKGSNYYIYLFNRKTNEFTIISDPYKVFFESGEGNWAIEPQVYQIHSIVR